MNDDSGSNGNRSSSGGEERGSATPPAESKGAKKPDSTQRADKGGQRNVARAHERAHKTVVAGVEAPPAAPRSGSA